MTRLRLLIACTITVLMIAGCAGSDTVPADGSSVGPGAGGGAGGSSPGASTAGGGAGGGIGVSPLDPAQQRLLDDLVIYFEFDRSDIRSEFNAMLAAHGQYLASNPNAAIRLEGHADERGTREYNIGLGERRSQAVRRILLLQGASAGQLSTVSYGEERPAAVGSDEESWSLNRRVELVY